MKDVAILTKYYKNYNYGGMLQGYALHKVVQNLGYSCDIISYNVGENKNPVYSNLLQQCKQYGIKSASGKVIEKCTGKMKFLIKDILDIRRQKFDEFMNETNSNTEVFNDSNLTRLNDEYKYFISGSDQVWNPNAVRLLYLQGFVDDTKTRIAYEASFGRDNLSEFEANKMIPYIKKFNYLGIREKTGTELLKKYIDNHIETVLDPTMLLTQNEWDSVSSKQIVNEDYAIFYFFSNSYNVRKKSEEFCKKNNLKMVLIPYAKQEYNFYDSKGESIRINDIGPKEFVSMIKYAKYVFTDSFHGAVFSIIYNKPFVVFERNKKGHVSMNSRLYDLLDTFELKDRLINDYENLNDVGEIDYSYVNIILDKEKNKSLSFLKKSLNN